MKLLYDTALSFLNIPTIWGGYSFLGYDCSGLVQEILRSAGIDPPKDQTAQALFNHFIKDENHITSKWDLGALAFYGPSGKGINHVTFLLNPRRMIEAGGAKEGIKTPGQAAKAGAFVRVSPIRVHNLHRVLMPEYPHCVI